MTTIGHKTRAQARKAAHRDLGAAAIEGVDFTLRNTGACWVAVKIAQANAAAKKAQEKRAKPISGKMHVTAKGLREMATRETPEKAAKLRTKADQQQEAARQRVAPEGRAIPKKAKPEPKPAAPAGQTKTDMLVKMISTRTGATSKEMEAATGWAPHSVRGLLGALRAKGVNVVSKKEKGSPTVYRIVKTKKPVAAPAADVGDVI